MAEPIIPSLDDYLKGKPLTPEMAEMMAASEEVEQVVAQVRNPRRTAITDDDRYHLKALRGQPGWEVLIRVLENAIVEQQESVILLSQSDPLRNKEGIALEWAYLACMRWAKRKLESALAEEMNLAKEDTENEILGE